MKKVIFRRPTHTLGDYDVRVYHEVIGEGEIVGHVRRHSEWYGNLGHSGVTYRYWIFSLPGTRERFAMNDSRKAVVAEALAKLGSKYDECAREVDPDTANHYIRRREEETPDG